MCKFSGKNVIALRDEMSIKKWSSWQTEFLSVFLGHVNFWRATSQKSKKISSWKTWRNVLACMKLKVFSLDDGWSGRVFYTVYCTKVMAYILNTIKNSTGVTDSEEHMKQTSLLLPDTNPNAPLRVNIYSLAMQTKLTFWVINNLYSFLPCLYVSNII